MQNHFWCALLVEVVRKAHPIAEPFGENTIWQIRYQGYLLISAELGAVVWNSDRGPESLEWWDNNGLDDDSL